MIKANEHQVGGTHYNQGGNPQHWDLVTRYEWDYFQSQIIKYIMRWKYKYPDSTTKLEDLRKARHFLDKYIEEYQAYLPATELVVKQQKVVVSDVHLS